MDSTESDESGTFTLKIKSKSDEHEGTQKKTFTKWINSQLSKVGSDVQVNNLFDDLRDGTTLLTLLEVLSGKKMRRERGRLRVHHLNNVNNAMTALENYNIKLVGISNNDIVDGNPKITLGLLWNIISHFQLLNALQSLMADFQGTPEEALLRWCRQSTKDYSNVSINNFTTSWKDGLAFNALIHKYRPDILKFDGLVGKSPSFNCENAFNIARDKLGVERLLDPEDVTRDRPDKKSIMMYVAMLYNKLSPNTTLSTMSSGGSNGVLATRDPYQRNAISSTTTSRSMQSTQVSSTVKRTVTTSYSSSSSSSISSSNEVKRSKVVSQSTSNGEPSVHITSTETKSQVNENPIQQTATTVVEHVLRERPDSFYNDSDSIRNSIGSFKDSESNRDSVVDATWEDYSSQLQDVLLWLSRAEHKLKSQPAVSRNVDVVKDQFHEHEDFMMELTSHQASVGGVLEYGNQLISEGLVSENEESAIRDQMISLNERWESLRISAMERQTSLHENLMKLQQQQIDQLATWLDKAEERIDRSNNIGADLESVRKQVENHKVFQEDLEKQQQQVNSLTHMVVVVDDAAGENATADLEEQLAQLGDRWSAVCRWTDQRWSLLQEVLNNWQDYRDEERRLTKWLSEKENQVESLKHVDLADPDSIAHNLQKLVNLEHEMEAQQATFGTFNMAAERVAEHLDEESPGLDAIQDKMEEFNDQWNQITNEVANRIALLKGLDTKVQPLKSEMDEKTYWLNETEMALKSPKMNFDNDKMSSDELSRQYTAVESLENGRNQRKIGVLAMQKKGDEIMEQIRAQGTIPVSFEHNLKAFNDRWETVSKMIDEKKQKASLARQRREVVDMSSKVESIVKDAERFHDLLGKMPDSEYDIKSQLDQCKNKIDDLHGNERHLVKLKELSRNLSKEDRQTPVFQLSAKRMDDRWTSVSTKIEDRKRQLTSILESGPPKEYLNTMDTVLMSLKSAESSMGGDFHITEAGGLEDQIRKYKQIQATIQEQKKNIDYLNSTADKFMKSLPRQKLEQIRSKLTDVNNKWKDVTMVIEKRHTQAQKAVNQNKKFGEELKSLYKWIAEVNDFLKDQEPAAGDPETLEAQLDQSEALQSDITKLQRKLDSLNETVTYMLAKATPAYAQKLHEQQDDVTNLWDSLVRHANRVKDNLLAALEKYQKLNHDMKEMSHWITQTERSIADDDRDIANGEMTKEKMEHYKELQQDVSKRAPAVVRINTTANQLADHTKQGTAKPLVESLKKLNSDWSKLKNKVAQRQHEFKVTQSELDQFHMALQRDNKLIKEVDSVAERSYDSLNGTEARLEEALRVLSRHLIALKVNGPGSVEEVANQLIRKNISVTMVTRQRDEFLERLEAMRTRAERTKQVLESELSKRQQMRKDFETIKIWITKIEVLITTRIAQSDDIDERELKSLSDEFSSHEELMLSVQNTCQELSQGPNGSTYANYLRDLDHLNTKWLTIQTKFTELKDKPMKKLGTEFEALVGDVLSQLDKINRGVKKLKLVSGDPRDIKNLQDQCLAYRDDLVRMRQDVDHVKKVGFDITEKLPEEKREGIERRIDEVHQEHRELVNKVNKKHEDLSEAFTLAGRIENEMTKLETWLDKTRVEAKRRVDAGFPEDVEEEIKWNKNTIKDVTGRLSEVQRLTETGRELVDLSETGQLESLEDRLTKLTNTWEDLSSLLEHRLSLLPKYKTQIKDFERLVDQLNEWLDKMNKEVNAVNTGQPESAEKLELLKEEVQKHGPQFQLIRQNSNEFVANGRHIMEPYRRLLDRRWEDLEAKISELEEELDAIKKGNVRSRIETEVIVKERKMISRPGMTEEYIHMEQRHSPDLTRPVVEETITTRRTFPNLNSAPGDDIAVRLTSIITEVKTMEELLLDIYRPKERNVSAYEMEDKIKQSELRLETLQPRVETILKESKTITATDSPNSDKVRHSLLDLSGRWLKACDDVDRNKRAVRIVPHWYQFTSNLEEINNSLKRTDGDDKPEHYVKDLTVEELEHKRKTYGMVVSDLEKLDKEGIQLITPVEANQVKRRLREINNRFEQYKKPRDDTTSYRVVVHTGDVKDADTRAKVSLVLYGDSGRSSPEIKLEKSETYLTPFRRDQLDIFHSGQVKNLFDLAKIKVWHDHSGAKPAWNVRSIYVQDKNTGKVYHFDCNTWIGKDRPGESKDLKCAGFVLSPDGEDIFNRHHLANIQWQPFQYTSARNGGASTGWAMVDEMNKLSEEVIQIDEALNSPELQGADYEDFSSQEDKLKSIGDRLESFESKTTSVFKRSETISQEQCSNEKEYSAVKKAASKLRLDWNNLNKDYKVRMVRWEKAQTVWRSFHCDLKDLTSWLNRVERILADTKMPNGDLNVDAAMTEQRSLEEGVSTHESVINSVNSMGEDIIRQSSAVEAKMFRDKLTAANRRWKVVVAEVDDRKNRFKEEEMQIQAFMEESGDLLQWMDETDAVLKMKDASPSDEKALNEQLAKIKEAERDIQMKDDSVKSIKQTGENLLTKTIFSKPNHDMVRTRLDLVLARWEILRMDGLTRRRGTENKLNRLNQFLNELEELSVWVSTTRDLLETQVNLREAGNTDDMVIDPKTVQESLRARQQTRDQINETMTVLRRESKLDSSIVPKTIENRVKTLNEDWAQIASQASELFASKNLQEVVVIETAQTQEASVDGWDTRASPWPKFDKAVSELHVWLDDVTDMMKAEKVVLSDSEEIFALALKQKSVGEQLQSKQHLLDEIAEMGHSLSEEAENREDKFIIENKVGKLKEHWETVQDNSTVWRGQIDFLLEEWKRYVELREELVEWLRKAEAYLKKEDNPYNYTVSDLDEQINKHKGFEEDLETWRGSITAVTQCGENLIKEFPTYESSALRHNMSELQERWDNIKNKSDTRRDNLKDAFERMVRFHEEMINALTWLTTTESKVAELDTMIDANHCEDDRDKVDDLKVELSNLEEDINSHQEMFASLNENGQHMVTEMEDGDVLTAVQSKLDDMNDRWQSLNSRTMDMHDRLEETSTEWRQLLLDLQEIMEWINRADQDITSQQPIGGDLEAVQSQNETHQAFKGKLNVRRLVVDRVLDSGHRMMDEYHGERAAGEAEGSSRSRIAGNIDKQLKNVDDQWSKLCQRSEEWQKNVDESLRKFQALNNQMEEVDVQLTEAEQARVTWTPVQDLVIESLHEQMDELKMLQERIANLQQMFENMSNTEGELRRRGVNLSANLQNRIDQLYRRWKQLQIQMLQRQNALQDAYPEGDSSSLQALQASVDPPWERAVAVNKVPYYINHKTETTQWDHPKMTELYHQIAELNDIKYSAYRTAMKLRAIQKATNLDMVTLENLDNAFESHGLHRQSNSNLIGISEMVDTLTTVYDNIKVGQENITTAICIDLTLNWLLNVYDSGRIGKIRLLSFKVGLVTMCRAHLEAKYKYLFRLVADNDGHMDHKQLGLLLHDSLQIPRQLGEIAAFGGSNIEPSVRSCFEKVGAKDRIDAPQFLTWLSAEPQSVVWLPTLHRLAASETVKHKAKCNICKEYPIVGFRFRCLKCFNYDLCQSCFWSGRVSHDHRLTHPMHQYCLSTTSGEDVKDFLSIVRNKFKKRQYKKNPPKKLGYLPIQTVMEGGNLETPPNPALQQNVSSEVHSRLGMYANRLAEAEETNGGKYSPKHLDEEHQLIAQYCQSLKGENTENAPRSPTQIVLSLDAEEKEDLESEINKLEDENRALQEEYERLKQIRDQENPSEGESSPGSTSRDAELLTEAKLLRQHKGRLEARMQVLEDHNKQLEAQLQRLRQLLDQPNQDNRSPPAYSRGTTPASSASSLGDHPYSAGRSNRSGQARPRGPESDTESDQAKDSVSDLFSTAQDVNKAVENLVQVMTDDDD